MTNMKVPLHDYQKYPKDFMLTHPYCGLFLTCGMGKTSIVLEALYELNPCGHVLIVAPKTVARTTWVNEIKKWNMPFRTKSLIVNDKGKKLTKKQRDTIFDEIPVSPPTVYFINRDIIGKLVDRFPGNQWCFPIVILDESQSFKSYTSERFKKLQTVRPYIFRLVELTGSPEPNGPMDLWAQIYLLDMGERLGKNITAYRNRFFDPGLIVNNYPVTWKPKYGAEDQIHALISDIAISMKNRYLTLPDITYQNMTIDMDPAELKRYKSFAKEYVLDLKNGDQIEASNSAVLSAKLSQMASGAIYMTQGSHDYEIIHEKKLEMCEYLINDTPGNILIGYHFHSDKDMLMNYLTKQGLEPVIFDGSPEMEQNWNQGKYPIMLIQPASCGAGLNLQNGGSTLIWYTIPWSLEHYEQTNFRIYRQGQQNQVTIYHLMTNHTIDTKILKSVQTKDFTQQRLMDAIEATIEELDTI